jgi:hypothetical protein
MRIRIAVCLVALCALTPARARGDSRWQVQPTLALSVLQDDNLFARPDTRDRARGIGIEPAVSLRYLRPRWGLTTAAEQTAEYYGTHPEIDTSNARRTASLRAESQVTRRLSAELGVFSFRTVAARGRETATRLDYGRHAARQWQAAPATRYAMNRTTTLTTGLTIADDAVDHLPSLASLRGTARVDRQASPESGVSIQYQIRRHRFGHGPAVASHRLALGYRRRLSRTVDFAFEGGPRMSASDVGVDWMGSARLHLRRFDLQGEWSEGETAVVGASGTTVVRRASLSCATSARALHGRAALDLLQSRGALEADLARATLEVGYRVAPALSIASVTAWSHQRGDLFVTGAGDIRRTVTELRLVVTPKTSGQGARGGR